MDNLDALHQWLEQTLKSKTFFVKPLIGDASFRRYFRLHVALKTYVVMYAPPQKENIDSYLAISDLLSTLDIKIPRIHALNKSQGFVLLDDFGDELLFNHLSPNQTLNVAAIDPLYNAAFSIILRLQTVPLPYLRSLAYFDQQYMLEELAIFQEWFISGYIGLQLTSHEKSLLTDTFYWLTQTISQQPRGLIHRDYHSRNIMVLRQTDSISLGIIDFQDAMLGPLTYDLVSLLKDCYVQWPNKQRMKWLTSFYHRHSVANQFWSFRNFVRAFDLCGLQRHLKVLGIFSRLYLRDNKEGYLANLPLVLHYVQSTLAQYEELNAFYHFMKTRIRLP